MSEPSPILNYESPNAERREFLRRRGWRIVATVAVLACLPLIVLAAAMLGSIHPEDRRAGVVLALLAVLAGAVLGVAIWAQRWRKD